MPGRGDRWINLLQSRSRLGLAGLSQFFLSVDSFLSLIDVRRRCGSRLSRAARERKASDVGDAVGDRDVGQAGAERERIVSDAGDAVSYREAGQA